jgi:hypothetical protein
MMDFYISHSLVIVNFVMTTAVSPELRRQYSMEISNGSNINCALSFKMQGAAR